MSGILQCFADRPEEKVRKWAPAVFLTPRSFAHIEFEWRLMQDEENEAHSPLELTIAPLSVHVYCLFGQSLCVSLKDVRFCLQRRRTPAPLPGLLKLFVGSVSPLMTALLTLE